MKKNLYYILSIILICSSHILASSGKIAGTILDSKTGEAAIGANVIIQGTTLGGATNIDGYYVILNVPPGTYTLRASMIGYAPSTTLNVRVNIDQTTEIDFELTEEVYETGEIVVVAQTPIVQRDVSSSGVNLNSDEIQSLPVTSVASVVGLQAGVIGEEIRGGTDDEVIYNVNGVTMRDGRDNTPYSNISFTSVEQIKVQTGGFTADVGEARSGVIEVVTKEGNPDKYNFSFYSQLSPASNKHFGPSVNDPNSFWLRPFLDPAVAWTGTKNGAWDLYTQRQYPEFDGWNEISRSTMQNNDPNDDLTPEAARRLFLWQHRKSFDIEKPDYDIDMSFGGPVPLISKELGNLRFSASYTRNRTMLLVPLSTDDYSDYNASLKITSDVSKGMKLMVEGHYGEQSGTLSSTVGSPGLFRSSVGLADRHNFGSYTRDVLYSDAYFTPSNIIRNSIAAKFTHVLNSTSFYEVLFSSFASDYLSAPGRARDLTKRYKFGNNYYVDEEPFGYFQGNSDVVVNPANLKFGVVYSQARDSSKVRTYDLKFDLSSQIDKYNQIKTGFFIRVSDNNTNYGIRSLLSTTNNIDYKWDNKPIQGAIYFQDKLEFEAMVATAGLRVEYSNPNTDWFVFSRYDTAFAAAYADVRDQILPKEDLPSQITVMPRLGVAFPITINSKIFLNYGHYQALPTPENLYLIRFDTFGKLIYISNPRAELERTIQYELGYEQNLFDQMLLRVTGYYKDISNQSRNITYTNNASVSFTKVEPVEYRDIRGFEIEINKNRGEWFTGFINYNYLVSSLGKFGWGVYNENDSKQIDYIKSDGQVWLNQVKPKPRPIARLNLDIFSPSEFGPEFMGFYPFEEWRINILSTWRAGNYKSWSGGDAITARTENNLQWLDYFNTDLRISKAFYFGPVDVQLYMQINNLFNTKRLSTTGFQNRDDEDYYFKSLHLPESISEDLNYPNIPGDDQPGDYRDFDVPFVPIEASYNINNIDAPLPNLIYYDRATSGYWEYVNDNWQRVDQGRMDKILEDKAYIDMPNFGFFTFLNPRDIYFGLKFNIAF
jgi:outer membrane receptor protein involved in Fe transport